MGGALEPLRDTGDCEFCGSERGWALGLVGERGRNPSALGSESPVGWHEVLKVPCGLPVGQREGDPIAQHRFQTLITEAQTAIRRPMGERMEFGHRGERFERTAILHGGIRSGAPGRFAGQAERAAGWLV